MDSEHDVTIWLITTSFRSTGGYSIVIRLDVSLPRPSIICVLEGPIRLDIRVQRGHMGNGSLSCSGREVVMLFHKINSQCREWPVWMKIDELREWSEWKVKRPMSPVHIGRVGFIHFPLLAGFMFACNGPGEWMGHHSLFPASHQTKKNLTLYFFAWNRGKMFPFSVDRHGNSPIGCDSFPLALLYFGGDSSWFCRYVIRPTLCAVNVTWSDNWLLTESLPSNLWKLTIFFKIVTHIPVVK